MPAFLYPCTSSSRTKSQPQKPKLAKKFGFPNTNEEKAWAYNNKVSYVMRLSEVLYAVAFSCNTANSLLKVDGKLEIWNKRIGYVHYPRNCLTTIPNHTRLIRKGF